MKTLRPFGVVPSGGAQAYRSCPTLRPSARNGQLARTRVLSNWARFTARPRPSRGSPCTLAHVRAGYCAHGLDGGIERARRCVPSPRREERRRRDTALDRHRARCASMQGTCTSQRTGSRSFPPDDGSSAISRSFSHLRRPLPPRTAASPAAAIVQRPSPPPPNSPFRAEMDALTLITPARLAAAVSRNSGTSAELGPGNGSGASKRIIRGATPPPPRHWWARSPPWPPAGRSPRCTGHWHRPTSSRMIVCGGARFQPPLRKQASGGWPFCPAFTTDAGQECRPLAAPGRYRRSSWTPDVHSARRSRFAVPGARAAVRSPLHRRDPRRPAAGRPFRASPAADRDGKGTAVPVVGWSRPCPARPRQDKSAAHGIIRSSAPPRRPRHPWTRRIIPLALAGQGRGP